MRQLLTREDGQLRKHDVNNEFAMAFILLLVGEDAREGSQSHLFHVPNDINYYIQALEEDPDLMKLVGNSYATGSFKAVRCLGTLF